MPVLSSSLKNARVSLMNPRWIIGGIAFAVMVMVAVFGKTTRSPKQEPTSQSQYESDEDLIGFPEFPVYPDAEVETAEVRLPPHHAPGDVLATWSTADKVGVVMQWYVATLPTSGWSVEPPSDPFESGEQIISIKNTGYSGYLVVEVEEEGNTEILLNVEKAQP